MRRRDGLVRRLDVGAGQPARPRRRRASRTSSEFRTYLRAALGADYDAARVDAFLAAAPEMVRFFHEQTALTFVPGAKICDVYGDLPGAGTGHRSVAPAPVDGRTLGDDVLAKLRRQLYETSFLGMGVMAGPDLAAFLSASRGNPRGLLHATRRVARHVYDLVTRRRGMQLVNGTALVGRLLRSALDLGRRRARLVPGHRAAPRRDGRVTGVVADTPDGPLRITAARGVVLAAGGFPHDVARRRALFPRTPTGAEHWSLAPETADGAGTTLGESAGGRLRTDVASPAAWCPVSLVPYRSGRTGVFPHIMDRAKPGSIGVLSTGRRFVNEANGYHDYVTAMIAAAPEGEPVQAWQIADARFVRRFPLGMAKPRPVPLLPYLRSGYLKKGRTLAELAAACGIDPGGAGRDRRGVQPARPPRRGPAVRPRRDPVQPLRRRPDGRPEPVARPAREGPVLRGADRARQLRDVRRARDRRPRPRPRRAPTPGPRPVRGRQRPGERDGRPLPGGRDQHRPGDDVRVHRGARPGRRRHGGAAPTDASPGPQVTESRA